MVTVFKACFYNSHITRKTMTVIMIYQNISTINQRLIAVLSDLAIISYLRL
jgi:hypothetical protein